MCDSVSTSGRPDCYRVPGTQPGLAVKCRNAQAKGKELVVREPVQVGCRRPSGEGCPAMSPCLEHSHK